MISGAAAMIFGPPTCGGHEHAQNLGGRDSLTDRVPDLPEIRGWGRVERDQDRDLDQCEAASVEAAATGQPGPQIQARGQQIVVT